MGRIFSKKEESKNQVMSLVQSIAKHPFFSHHSHDSCQTTSSDLRFTQKELEEVFEKGQEKGRKEGQEKGREEGREKGREEGQEKGEKSGYQRGCEATEQKLLEPLREHLIKVQEMIKNLETFRSHLFQECEQELIQFVQKLCKKILLRETKFNPESFVMMVKQALELVGSQRRIVLRMNPMDHPFYQQVEPKFLEMIKGLEQVELMSDSSVAAGTLKIETATCDVHVDIEAMVEHLFIELKEHTKLLGDANANSEEKEITT